MRYGRIPVIKRLEQNGVVAERVTLVIVVGIAVVVAGLFRLLPFFFVFSLLFFPGDLGVEIDLAEVRRVVGGMEVAAVDQVGQQGLDITFVVVDAGQLKQTGEEDAGQGEGVADIAKKVVVIGTVIEYGRVLAHQLTEQPIRRGGLMMRERFQDGILENAGVACLFVDVFEAGYYTGNGKGIVDVAELVDELCPGLEVILIVIGKTAYGI